MIIAAGLGNGPPAYFSVFTCQKFLSLVSEMYVAEVLPEDYCRKILSYLTTFQEFS